MLQRAMFLRVYACMMCECVCTGVLHVRTSAVCTSTCQGTAGCMEHPFIFSPEQRASREWSV